MSQFRREGNTSFSPLRELYGKKNGLLLFPLDLCIMLDQDGQEVLSLPNPAGVLNGDSVTNTGGGVLGAIAHYDWPPANMAQVRPLTLVTPAIDIGTVPDGTALQPIVHHGDAVGLETLDDSFQPVAAGVIGAITDPIISNLYPDLGHRVQAYRVKFGQHILGPSHGARVVLQATGDLLGLLIATLNQSDGTCDALVYPAHLV